jgi:hypothetical protein
MITVTGIADANGNLAKLSVKDVTEPGPTPIGSARMFYPGLAPGQPQHVFNLTAVGGSYDFTFEQHASVSPFEEIGMHALGVNIVNVAQKFTFDITNNQLTMKAFTDIFPSATLTMNGYIIGEYKQPSFIANFSLPIVGWTPVTGSQASSQPIYDYSYKPASWIQMPILSGKY